MPMEVGAQPYVHCQFGTLVKLRSRLTERRLSFGKVPSIYICRIVEKSSPLSRSSALLDMNTYQLGKQWLERLGLELTEDIKFLI